MVDGLILKTMPPPKKRLTAKSYVHEKQTYNYQIAVMREPVSHQAKRTPDSPHTSLSKALPSNSV